MMSVTVDDRSGVTCETALNGDTIAAYVGGRLDESEAEAFEQHYFGCEDCWSLVRTATAARTSLTSEVGVASTTHSRPTRRWRLPAAALAAAVAGLVFVGVWQANSRGEVFRGSGETMRVEVAVGLGLLRATWEPVAGAAGYELRVYDEAGRLLITADAVDEVAIVDLQSLELGRRGTPTAVDVVALDGFGQVMRRSQQVSLVR
jgi:hypothetical protein